MIARNAAGNDGNEETKKEEVKKLSSKTKTDGKVQVV